VVERLWASCWALLKALDILACTVWLAPLYVVGLADRPSGRQMISSYVGRAAHNGHRWGLRAAGTIDFLARLLGDGPDHCRRAYLSYRGLDD
jgi:hypothetical protein